MSRTRFLIESFKEQHGLSEAGQKLKWKMPQKKVKEFIQKKFNRGMEVTLVGLDDGDDLVKTFDIDSMRDIKRGIELATKDGAVSFALQSPSYSKAEWDIDIAEY
jgi:hypothetical protein